MSKAMNQKVFLAAIGVDPETVLLNTIQVGINPQGQPVVSFQTVMTIDPGLLGMAFMAGGGMMGQGADGESEPTDEPGTNAGDPPEPPKTRAMKRKKDANE